ncbi:hypothetical protein ILYODFUR_039051 [Ilyodon furcidens]|uniref:Uncharacterized protein n=1 Tax=Ilyodon furcidens TaxID=33524 RepID=A0ABV0VNP0_9TELE
MSSLSLYHSHASAVSSITPMPSQHNTFVISMPPRLESSLSCFHKLFHLPRCLCGTICHSHAFSISFIILTALPQGSLSIFFHFLMRSNVTLLPSSFCLTHPFI